MYLWKEDAKKAAKSKLGATKPHTNDEDEIVKKKRIEAFEKVTRKDVHEHREEVQEDAIDVDNFLRLLITHFQRLRQKDLRDEGCAR